MNFKSLNRLLIGSVLTLSCLVNSAHAGLITIGALTSNDDGSTSVITDTRNNFEWLRWDQFADLTHAETLVQSSALGWTIAGVKEANLFIDALLNRTNHACVDNDTTFIVCGDSGNFSSADYTALLGDSFTRGTSSVDAAWFYDDLITDGSAGVLNLEFGTKNEKYNTFGNIALTDTYASTSNESIGWLMYRTSTPVTEPSTLAIFAIALLGFASRRFKKTV